MLEEEKYGLLMVRKFGSRAEMGAAAGQAVVAKINELLGSKDELRMIFAAAPSQNEMLKYLTDHSGEVDWSRITAFHMDEYIGLEEQSEQLFSSFLKQRLFDLLPFKQVNIIDSKKPGETSRYAQLILEDKIDIVCLGIGENGHIAFNDPPVADFKDPETVKIVRLDEMCRAQQVNDGCFPSIDEVPTQAITLTIPTLLNADFLFCVVPGETKSEAVRNTLHSPITVHCPATILRTHQNCILYLDKDSFPE